MRDHRIGRGKPAYSNHRFCRELFDEANVIFLRAFLAKQYAAADITPQEIEAVINQLEAYSAADLYESNKAIMKLVSDRFAVSDRRPRTKEVPHA